MNPSTTSASGRTGFGERHSLGQIGKTGLADVVRVVGQRRRLHALKHHRPGVGKLLTGLPGEMDFVIADDYQQ